MTADKPHGSPRRPGQYGLEVVQSLASRAIARIVLLAGLTALVGLAVGTHNALFVVVELAAIVAVILIDRKLMPELDRRMRGVEGEVLVGGVLDALAADGWRTLHDVDLGHGNIDHVAIGPGGVFSVETKSHAGRLKVADLDPKWFKQAYAQKKLLERVMGRSHVDCLLVLSNAYLDKPATRRRGVMVLPARMLAGHLARRKPLLSEDEVEALHSRLAVSLAA